MSCLMTPIIIRELNEHSRRLTSSQSVILPFQPHLTSASPSTCSCLLTTLSQGKPLQTGFLAGMEEILGITQDRQVRRGALTRGVDELGDDAVEADLQAEAEGNDEARHRYQRMFWEPVVEGRVSLSNISFVSIFLPLVEGTRRPSGVGESSSLCPEACRSC